MKRVSGFKNSMSLSEENWITITLMIYALCMESQTNEN